MSFSGNGPHSAQILSAPWLRRVSALAALWSQLAPSTSLSLCVCVHYDTLSLLLLVSTLYDAMRPPHVHFNYEFIQYPYLFFKSRRINSFDIFSLSKKLRCTSICECWRSTVYSGLCMQLPSWLSRFIWYCSWDSIGLDLSISLTNCFKHLKLLDSIAASTPSGLNRLNVLFSG